MTILNVAVTPTKTILLLNRESSIRELMQDCLSQLGGWRVVSASSIVEGLQSAIHHQPDAIVLDFYSSSETYVTFLQKLRAHPETRSIPVVVLTAGAKWLDSNQLRRFQVVGVIDYVADPTQLSNQIAQLLNWHEPDVDEKD